MKSKATELLCYEKMTCQSLACAKRQNERVCVRVCVHLRVGVHACVCACVCVHGCVCAWVCVRERE